MNLAREAMTEIEKCQQSFYSFEKQRGLFLCEQIKVVFNALLRTCHISRVVVVLFSKFQN